MKLTNGFYNTDIPSLLDVVKFLSWCDTPLGDLCHDILSVDDFPFDNTENAWEYLNNIRIGKDYLDEPIRRLKTIYSTIYKS
jgi:hypothetical protein